MFRLRALLPAMLMTTAAAAEVIILKNGSFVEGRIAVQTRKTIRVDTRFGLRTFSRDEIDEIIPSADETGAKAVADFASLPPPVKAVLNARADYDLGNYERALSRLEPLRSYDRDRVLRMEIDWLVIELNERLGRWETARRLLREKVETGTPPEKSRAKAHLDIFELNPRFDLRYVGDKHARNFISRKELRDRARERESLRHRDIMRLALEEYCEQLLVEDRLSVKAYADRLDRETTYNAVVGAGPSGDLSRVLPYLDDLKHAEASLLKAQAILGDYGAAFELDLARAELNHLLLVSDRLFGEVIAMSPERFIPASDGRTGRLTGDGRRAWRERCDEFLAQARPLTQLYKYMVDKVNHHPDTLRDLRKFLVAQSARFDEMVKAVKKAKGRTHV